MVAPNSGKVASKSRDRKVSPVEFPVALNLPCPFTRRHFLKEPAGEFWFPRGEVFFKGPEEDRSSTGAAPAPGWWRRGAAAVP